MNKSLKYFFGVTYLVILILFLYLIFSNIEITKLNDFSYIKQLQSNIEQIIGKNLYKNLFLFFLFSIIWVTLLGFGSPLLIISGIFFGKWVGTAISVISISIGALTLYTFAGFFFKDLVKKLINEKIVKIINVFKKNEFNYFFLYRFVGGFGVPFFLQNIFPVIFDMKKRNYFFSSFLGFIPGFFIFNSIGSGLNQYIKNSDNFNFFSLLFTYEIYMPICLFTLFLLISFIIKKVFFNA
tara:strand:+ start:1739 stop:2455 length:717 start_codon:yes stop_codon:yes gene_type:complete